MIISPVYLYEIKVFDIASTLNILKDNKIKIINLIKLDDYTYRFNASICKDKVVKKLIPNIKIIKKEGLINNLFSILKYKTTIVAMILSIASYCLLSNRIWIINITGDSTSLVSFVEEKLHQKGINVGCKKLDVNTLSEIQNNILYSNFDVIEYLSIKSNGSAIDVTFKKKRKETDKTKFKGNLYASKDGMIKSFDLLSGNRVVDINDYVKKGDLLVKDVLTTDYNEEVYIGTYGSVYAYTWYYSTISYPINELDSNETILANALLEAKHQICLNFSNSEYIYQENVLQFIKQDNNVFIKIHFTCVEDIAKE